MKLQLILRMSFFYNQSPCRTAHFEYIIFDKENNKEMNFHSGDYEDTILHDVTPRLLTIRRKVLHPSSGLKTERSKETSCNFLLICSLYY
jgi:hypothetical protein